MIMVRATLITIVAGTVMSVVLCEECPKHMEKIMRPLSKCCKYGIRQNVPTPHETRAATESCIKEANYSKVDFGTPSGGFGCFGECLVTKMGLMEEDKTPSKEKMLKFVNEYLVDEFHEASAKAMDTCMATKYNTKCPTGIDGLMRCFPIRMMLECPANYWQGGEECEELKKFLEACGTKLYEDIGFFDRNV